jgi:SAM-dependent methyltransferase
MQEFWKDFTVIDTDRPDLGGNYRRGDSKSITPKLWRYLVDRFAIRSILDVGCGEGHALAAFRRMGVIAHGIDGLRANLKAARHPFAVHDLTVAPYVYPCDLVLCVEVVEHVAERHLSNVMGTLANGPVVVMTHGLPGQPGHHHVNLQPAEYWVSRFARIGYHLAPDNEWLKQMADDEVPGCYFGNSGLVFIKP